MIYYILFVHWLADFVLQKREWAENKSSSLQALCAHVGTYTLCLYLALTPFMRWDFAVTLAAFNGVAHLITDAITSRITKRAYEKQQMKLFWSTIGFDQFLHVAVLIATFNLTSSVSVLY